MEVNTSDKIEKVISRKPKVMASEKKETASEQKGNMSERKIILPWQYTNWNKCNQTTDHSAWEISP